MEQMQGRHKKVGNIIFLIQGQQEEWVSDSTRVPITLGLFNVPSHGEKSEQKETKKSTFLKKG